MTISAHKMRGSQHGFTLVELMISLVIFSFAIAGVLSVAVSSTRAFREQRRAVATETAARAPMDFLVDAVRGASPGVGVMTGLNVPRIGLGDSCQQLTASVVGCTNCVPSSGPLMINDSESGPDELYVVYAAGGVVWTTYTDVTASSTTVKVANAADFSANDTVMFVSDGSLGTLRTVKTVDTTTNTITLATATSCSDTNVWPTAGYPKGSLLLRVTRAKFSVGYYGTETAANGYPPFLFMNVYQGAGDEPVAEGVEDMQIALGVDTNNDSALSDDLGTTGDEWYGNAAGDSAAFAALTTYTLRALKIVLIAREFNFRGDAKFRGLQGPASFSRPAALNHSAGSADNFRRRVLFSTVQIRNLSLTGS